MAISTTPLYYRALADSLDYFDRNFSMTRVDTELVAQRDVR
jgi:hypothetical protein